MKRSSGAFIVILISLLIVVWLAVNQFSFLPKTTVTDPETGETIEQTQPEHAKDTVDKLNEAQQEYVDMYDNMYEENE